MNVLGIVAEYDPFHNGHLHHLEEAKRLASPGLTYVALSPCFLQRGTMSLLSPADRALCALEAGADAVFCLPVLWTVRNAENYALGAVSLLSGLGVTHLAFGAETPDPELLHRAAGMLECPSDMMRQTLKTRLDSGEGYPAALSAALCAALPEADGLLDRPNNTLAVCYLRAILRLNASIRPVVIPRSGDYRAHRIDPLFPSASAVREAILRGNDPSAYRAVPDVTASLLRRRLLAGTVPDASVADAVLLSRLRSMSETELRELPDLSEGMECALRDAAASVNTREALITALSGRRYPAARISRLAAYALLGITRDTVRTAPLPENALLLGLRRNPEMTSLWRNCSLPVISSFTGWKDAAHPADLAAWRLWAQCCRLPDTLPFSEQIVCI